MTEVSTFDNPFNLKIKNCNEFNVLGRITNLFESGIFFSMQLQLYKLFSMLSIYPDKSFRKHLVKNLE